MSFRCDACGEAQEPKVKPSMIVAERRERRYSSDISGVLGWEIAREEKVCPTCYDAHRQEEVLAQ